MKSPAETERLRAAGYVQAEDHDRCGLCRRVINPGQWVKRMPEGWQPENTRRHAHKRCVAAEVERIRAKAEAAKR